MDKFATENLILLEFLVDRVSLDEDVSQHLSVVGGETCVSFQFLDNAPLYVCEEDFSPKRSYKKDCGNIKNGKSCLFSLTPDQATQCTKQFDIYVTVFKKMTEGVLPDKIQIGETLISIVNLFNELVQTLESRTNDSSPAAKTMKDVFKVTKSTGEVIGHISVYIRMSCFGKLIVTQFQMDLEDKSVQFKAKEGHYLFKYNKKNKQQVDVDVAGCPPTCPVAQKQNMNGNGGIQGCVGEMMGAGMNTMGCQRMMGTGMGGMGMGGMGMGGMGMGGMGMGGMGMGGMGMAMGGIGMGMGGGMMGMGGGNMTVPCLECDPAYALQDPRNAGMCPAELMNPPCMQSMGGGGQLATVCGKPSCPAATAQMAQPIVDPPGCFQEIGASMGGNALTIRVHKEKTKENQDTCACGGGAPAPEVCPALQATPCPGGQPTALNMQPGIPGGNNKNFPFEFKLAGCGAAPNNAVSVIPPVSTAPDGTQFTEISDPDRDLFILRIGKKSEGACKKNNLELELCTPKGLGSKPIPKKETRDTQYDPNDCGGAEEKKKGGKPAKGKGKEGKGGKGKGDKGKGKGKKKK